MSNGQASPSAFLCIRYVLLLFVLESAIINVSILREWILRERYKSWSSWLWEY